MRRYGRERYNLATTMMDEEEEGDSEDEDVDMPSLLPRVEKADERDHIITHDSSADGLSEEGLHERLIWDQMSRPLLDGGEGSPIMQIHKQSLIAI